MSTAARVKIDQLLISRDAWPRFASSEERVDLFAQLILSGEELPAIEVIARENEKYLIADGVHRTYAALRAGRSEIDVVVIEPSPGESDFACAFRRALETATKTALPLTTAERRSAAVRIARDQPGVSHREIARRVGVSHDSVDRWLRPEQAEASGGDEPDLPGPPLLTADKAARQLVTGLARLYESRGIADLFVPARMGKHLAEAFEQRFGDEALKEATRFASWATRAVAILESAKDRA
jgi:transposase-like protein